MSIYQNKKQILLTQQFLSVKLKKLFEEMTTVLQNTKQQK